LLRDTRGLRRDQATARDAWYGALPWDKKEETLFELEALLKGVACFGNARNHPGQPDARSTVAQDFQELLRVLRDAAQRVVQLTRQLLGDKERAYTFTRYLESLDGQKLFTKKNGKRLATPLLAVLVVIEISDLVFAIDSVPAVLAVSNEQFIVFAANAFAIMGLRALYFLFADIKDRFVYLKPAISVLLIYVGIKMTVAHWYHVPTVWSLGFITLTMTVAIVASIRKDRKH
jgi:hypothetical protein